MLITIGWYVIFYLAAFVAGGLIASTNAGERMVWTGLIVAVIGGPLIAQLSKLARRLDRDKHTVRVELALYRFTWVWSTIWFGAALIAAWAVVDQFLYTYFFQNIIMLIASVSLIVAGWFARLAGTSSTYFRVDVAAGVVEYVGGAKPMSCALDELGAFEIEEVRRPRTTTHGVNPLWYQLTIAGFPGRLFADDVYPTNVTRLKTHLEERFRELRDLAAVRRVLAETPSGADYRGVSLDDALAVAVEDPGRRRIALAALTRDLDPEIRARASGIAPAPTS